MVRKGEIACRDGWSRDLWAPRTDATNADAANAEPRQEPLPPISPEEMSVLVDSGQVELEASTHSAAPVDVVVGESPAMPPIDDRATLLSHDPRAAIEAARKRHAAKSTASESPEVTSDADSGVEGSEERADEGRTPSGSTIVWRPNPGRGPLGKPQTPPAVSSPAIARSAKESSPDHFSTVPDRQPGVDLPRASATTPAPAAPTIAGAAQDIPEDPRRQSLQRLRDRQSRLGIAPVAPREDVPYANLPVAEDDEFSAPSQPKRNWRGFRSRDIPSASHDPRDEFEWNDPAPYERHVEPEVTAEALDTDIDVESIEYEVNAPGPDDELAYALAGQYDDLDIGDTSVHVAPEVPRMCKTCRDFRPADSGERGWCNNNWAFSHRRMVDADELPCESSLGCWWLPHDDVWLSTADAGSHSEPTPLVDLWLSRRDASARRRQGS